MDLDVSFYVYRWEFPFPSKVIIHLEKCQRNVERKKWNNQELDPTKLHYSFT